MNLGSYDDEIPTNSGYFTIFAKGNLLTWTELNDKNEAYIAGGLLDSDYLNDETWMRLSSSPLSYSNIIKVPAGSTRPASLNDTAHSIARWLYPARSA